MVPVFRFSSSQADEPVYRLLRRHRGQRHMHGADCSWAFRDGCGSQFGEKWKRRYELFGHFGTASGTGGNFQSRRTVYWFLYRQMGQRGECFLFEWPHRSLIAAKSTVCIAAEHWAPAHDGSVSFPARHDNTPTWSALLLYAEWTGGGRFERFLTGCRCRDSKI